MKKTGDCFVVVACHAYMDCCLMEKTVIAAPKCILHYACFIICICNIRKWLAHACIVGCGNTRWFNIIYLWACTCTSQEPCGPMAVSCIPPALAPATACFDIILRSGFCRLVWLINDFGHFQLANHEVFFTHHNLGWLSHCLRQGILALSHSPTASCQCPNQVRYKL